MKVRHNYNGFKGGQAKFTKFNFFKSRNNDMEFVRVTIADRFVVGLLLTPNFNNNLQNSWRQ